MAQDKANIFKLSDEEQERYREDPFFDGMPGAEDFAIKQSFLEAFDAENFRKQGHQIIDILADYLEHVNSGKIDRVLPAISPDEMLKNWSACFSGKSHNNLTDMAKKIVSQSNHLHHPGYMGRQVSSSLPAASLFDLVTSFLNNSNAVYEMAPVGTAVEKSLINWMSGLIGFNSEADGFFTSGGTLGNLTALLAARQSKTDYDIWEEGTKNAESIAVLVSEQAHYSIKRAIQIMGLGKNGAIQVPVDNNYRMDMAVLEKKYKEAVNSGKKIIAVVGSACTTATGSYDQLDLIANFCEKYNLWFHVDGAHGASALVSDKYKHLLKGIERADSVVWDAHKMLLMPSLITAIIFRHGNNSYEAFSQKASYIFDKKWYNLAHRTIECTKPAMGLKLYACLSIYGMNFFSNYITSMYDLTSKFASILEKSPDFELIIPPQSNIICFRYIPEKTDDLDDLQKQIRQHIIEKESFYITKITLQNKIYLRCIIINPLTTENDIKNLLKKIREFFKLDKGEI